MDERALNRQSTRLHHGALHAIRRERHLDPIYRADAVNATGGRVHARTGDTKLGRRRARGDIRLLDACAAEAIAVLK